MTAGGYETLGIRPWIIARGGSHLRCRLPTIKTRQASPAPPCVRTLFLQGGLDMADREDGEGKLAYASLNAVL